MGRRNVGQERRLRGNGAQFGRGERKPRPIEEPGTFYEYNDVRINRFSLSLLRLFGQSLPEVLKTGIMDPIGASHDWRWEFCLARVRLSILAASRSAR